jgi:cytochrome c oxidase assembly factor CtaG
MTAVARCFTIFCAVAGALPGHPTTWSELALAWTLEPVVVVPLALSGWLYFRGLERLWSEEAGRGVRRWEASAYALGWLTLFVALVSPVHSLSRMLFSVHMTQHELLMLVAAPLLVLGRPLVPMLWALPIAWRRRLGDASHVAWWQKIWRIATLPLVATILHAAALWVWHIPGLYGATIENEWIHAAMHVCFLGTALLFWWALVHGRRGIVVYGAGVLYLFVTSVESGALGALLTVARSVVYPAYRTSGEAWGLTGIEDQQLAGLIMWVPAGLVYVAAALAMIAGWLRESDRRLARNERLSRSVGAP